MVQASKNLSVKERKQAVLENFRGVDMTSSPLSVAPYRASSARNIINRSGVNRKRHGWVEQCRVSGRINCLHYFAGYWLIHAGTKLYKAEEGTSGWTLTDVSGGNLLTDDRSQMLTAAGKVYLIGVGKLLVYDGTSLSSVSDTAYIPTTTINIDNTSSTDTAVDVLDDINMLTEKRKNTLVGTSSTGKTWKLDGTIDTATEVSLDVELSSGGELITEHWICASDSNTILFAGAQKGTINREQGTITLTVATEPPVANAANITVTFSHTNEGYKNLIHGMRFGVLFGIGGNSNRLFLAGNPEKANRFYYSESDDPSFISDQAYADCGQTAITGFARLNDDTLAILKEPSVDDPTIYYTRGSVQTDYNAQGQTDRVTAVFTVTAGSIGEASVNRHCVANLNGDNLMLTRTGVFGLTLTDNIATSVRNARERSQNISAALQGRNLTDACAIVFDNKYFLKAGDNVFVADARYRFTSETDLTDSFNYEWWCLDNIPARMFGTDTVRLYFGTEDGRICRFEEGFSDIEKEVTDPGDLSFDLTENRIIYNAGIEGLLKDGDTIRFTTDHIYAKITEADYDAETGVLVLDSINGIYGGRIVYITGEAATCEITDLDRGTQTCKTVEDLSIESGRVGVYILLSGKELIVCDLDEYGFGVKEFEAGERLDLEVYGGHIISNPVSVISFKNNVVAEWYTPIMDLGTNTFAKTLERLTVTTEPEINGHIQFGFNTRNTRDLIQAKGTRVFSFDQIDFENFTFDTGFASSFTKYLNVRNFNYILFRLYSDTNTDFAVANITATYKINNDNKGVQ